MLAWPLFVLVALSQQPSSATDEPEAALDWPLAYSSDFGKGLDGWSFTDAEVWKIQDDAGSPVLAQVAQSKYEPPFRSPFNIAFPPVAEVSDFVLDLEVRSTTPDYGHRDVCLVFGHQDPSHFYYTHIAKAADAHAHSIFLVRGAPRASICQNRTAGVDWTDGWHHVRVVREVGTGSIRVYFDDMATPIMSTNARAYTQGRVGIGTFDDTAEFRNVRLWAKPPA